MALTGQHLKVTAEYWSSMVAFDGDFENPRGIAVDIFNYIAKQLNFTYSFVLSVDRTWGTNFYNGTVTGMVGMVYRKEVDIGMGPFMMTYDRSHVVDFSNPFIFDDIAILLPRPKLQKDMANFIRPFASQVWIGLLLSVLLGGVLGELISRTSIVQNLMKTATKGEHKKMVFFEPLWMLRIFTSDVVILQPVLTSGLSFLGTFFLANLFLSSAYSAVLTSLLAVPRVTIPVDSLQDLVKYEEIPWALEYGTAHATYFLDSINTTNTVAKTIGEKMDYVRDCKRGKERIRQEGMALICDYLSMMQIIDEEFTENGTCSYYIAREKVFPIRLAFIFPKGSPFKDMFNQWIDVLFETGLIEKRVNEMTQNTTTCLRKPGTNQKNTVVFGIKDLAGIFLLLGTGMMASLVAAVFEGLFSWLKLY